MTILEALYKKYGEHKISCLLAFLSMQDAKRYDVFLQYITLTEYFDVDISNYKLLVNNKLNTLYDSTTDVIEFFAFLDKFDSRLKKYNTIITYGTFDLFHNGHLELLKRCKLLCNNLIVGVSTDEFNLLKGKTCIIPYIERAAIVSSIKYVDKVIPENNWEQKINDIKNYNVNCFIMGSDWKGKFDHLKEYCDVLYLSRTVGISSTDIKNKLNK